jgi:hypothetical protein
MITIRKKDFTVALRGPAMVAVRAWTATHAVKRVDIWPGRLDTGQVGIVWDDGSSTIFDTLALAATRAALEGLGCLQPAVHPTWRMKT